MSYLLRSPLCPHRCYCVHATATVSTLLSVPLVCHRGGPPGPACKGCGRGTGPLQDRFTPRSIVLNIRSGFSHIVTLLVLSPSLFNINTNTRLG